MHHVRGPYGHLRASTFQGSNWVEHVRVQNLMLFYIVYVCVFASTISYEPHLQRGKLRLREVNS